MPDLIALGELLIDFVSTQPGLSLAEAPAFQKAPGGAPANVAVGLARLGISSGFMGKIGDDPFGHFLAQTLANDGVDTSTLHFSKEARTALAFVSLRADGERDFMFYRHPSADMLLRPDEISDDALRGARAFHFGSITLIGEPSRSATYYAAQTARDMGLLVSYDPNLRLNLWPSADAARAGIMLGWPLANVIKITDEELAFLTGIADPILAASDLWHDNLRLLVVTRGRAGCTFITSTFTGGVPGFPVHSVDTTGAGDGFVAGLLKGLLEQPQAFGDANRLQKLCRYANAVGALTTTRRGAIPALPTAAAIATFLSATT